MIAGLTSAGLPHIDYIDANGHYARRCGKKCSRVPIAYPVIPEQVELCKQWIQEFCTPRTTPNQFGSYTLKHVVERHFGTYISNGAFIAAADAQGYAPEQGRPHSPNGTFKFWIRVEGFEKSKSCLAFRRFNNGRV